MNGYRQLWRRGLFYGILLLLVPYWLPQFVHAQATGQASPQGNRGPTLQISQVDTSQFPLLAVTVRGANWPIPFADLPIALTLDGNDLPIIADEAVQQGLQLAIAIDVNNFLDRGPSGQSGYIETVGTVRSLVENGTLVRNQDWLAAYFLQGEAAPQLAQEWTQEPNLVFNSIVSKRPTPENSAESNVETPLSELTLRALFAQFATVPRVALPKAILLFTTGATLPNLDELLAQAQTEAITIHVVALRLAQNPAPPPSISDEPLQQLAAATGGQYVVLENLEAVTPLVNALTTARTARQLQVRADTATPQTLAASSTLPDGNIVNTTADPSSFAAINVAPAQIAIAAPTAAEINWQALAVAPDNADERLLPIQASFTWPNNQVRQLRQVSYTLSGPNGFARQEIRTAAPFDQATLALPAPGNGAAGDDYTLEIMALDELGVEALYTAPALHIQNPAAVEAAANVPAAAPAAVNAGVPDAVTATTGQSTDTVTIPGLQLQLSRRLLTWLLPVLLLLIAYLVYSERRERNKREQVPAAPQTRRDNRAGARPNAGADAGGKPGGKPGANQEANPVANPAAFMLQHDSPARTHSRYQLKPAPKQTADAYVIDEHHLREEAPVHRGAPGRASQLLPTPALRQEKPVFGEETPSKRAGREELAWAPKDELADSEKLTVTPARMDDEEATYQAKEVARPVIGYLVRATSDPNLPKELPIYGLNPAPGQLRQVHIGRHSKHNTVVINDKSVSREHAVIIQREKRLYLRDNASTAGTFLNWKRLNPGEELLLRHNDLISFGRIAYEFRIHGEDEATSPNG